MYQALYRKYRPTTLDQIVGQDVIIKTLKNTLLNQKINHAYLFTGPRGTGKTSIAKILAKNINCLALKEADSCGECVSCTQIKNKQTTDIIEIDAASNNGVDEIRELKSKVNLVPTVGNYKVYIIDEVHMLTIGAFNALLKTLEEPPPHIVFILATTEPHKIPTTILSRCQRFDFKKISESKIYSRLEEIVEKEVINIDKPALLEIAHLSDGGLRDAISTLDQVRSYAEDKITTKEINEVNGTLPLTEISNLIQTIINKDKVKTFELINNYNNDGKNLIKIIEEIIIYLKNLLIYKISPDLIENKKEYDLNDKLISEEEIQNLLLIIIDTFNTIKTYSDSKLVMEIIMIKLLITPLKNGEELNVKPMKEVVESNQITDQPKVTNLKKSIIQKPIQAESKNISELKKIIEQGGKIRINNALSAFNKKQTLEIKREMDIINNYILDPIYSKIANIIIDGELRAASNQYLIYVYKTQSLADSFNFNIPEIEDLIKTILDKPYKVFSVSLQTWEKIKQNYNVLKKKYEMSNEKDNLTEDIIQSKTMLESKNGIEELFNEIIEYEER